MITGVSEEHCRENIVQSKKDFLDYLQSLDKSKSMLQQMQQKNEIEREEIRLELKNAGMFKATKIEKK